MDDRMSDKGKDGRNVYILQSTYKHNDSETLGVYDSKASMCVAFAKLIAENEFTHAAFHSGGTPVGDRDAVLELVAKIGRLLPRLICGGEFGDYCRYGKTVYGFEVREVESCDGYPEEECDGEEAEE